MAKAGRKPIPKSKGKGLLKRDFGPVDLFGFARQRRERQRLQQILLESLERREQQQTSKPSTQSPSVRKPSGKAWVPAAYAQRPGELLAMGITDASHALAEQSKTDCAKELNARYIEKLLRELEVFPKAHRGSPKQRPK